MSFFGVAVFPLLVLLVVADGSVFLYWCGWWLLAMIIVGLLMLWCW